VPPQLGRQCRPEGLHRHRAADFLEPALERLTGPSEPFPGGLTTQQEAAATTEPAIMRQAQELERVRLTTFPASAVPLEPAKTHRPGLFRVQRQAKLGEPLREQPFELIGAVTILHQHQEVVGIPYQVTVSADLPLNAFVEPQVQYIV